ncbi:WGR domain-containing protein [Microvirga rosea]|uniref:WGR domain-containing protein n=1 Tax=Microvirga rosea TaxID=2715425 RepID=UPI001D0B6927|nr:WGR domain-containing protein [Microvirga rosea]MCB8822884.1 WGR domain-containing protein [Microvirga rosea]
MLTRCDPGRNMKRFYALRVEADLFGGVVLVREWGRTGGASRVLRQHFAQAEATDKTCAALRRKKLRRGYTPSGSPL